MINEKFKMKIQKTQYRHCEGDSTKQSRIRSNIVPLFSGLLRFARNDVMELNVDFLEIT